MADENQQNTIGELNVALKATGGEEAKREVEAFAKTVTDSAKKQAEATAKVNEHFDAMPNKVATASQSFGAFTQNISFFNGQLADSVAKVGLLTNGVQAVAGMIQGSFNTGKSIGEYFVNQDGQNRYASFTEESRARQASETASQKAERFSQDVYNVAGLGTSRPKILEQIARKETLEKDLDVARAGLQKALGESLSLAGTADENHISLLFDPGNVVDAKRKIQSIKEQQAELSQLSKQQEKLQASERALFANQYANDAMVSTFSGIASVPMGQAASEMLLRELVNLNQPTFYNGPR